MSDRTGFAVGRVSPIVFYDNSAGEVVLPPSADVARYYYSEFRDGSGRTYRDRGFELREAGTLAEVDALQRRLVERDRREAEGQVDRQEAATAEAWRRRGSDLYARMVSAATPEYEKEFIRAYLQVRDDKRARYRQAWLERQSYLWAREQDSAHAVEGVK